MLIHSTPPLASPETCYGAVATGLIRAKLGLAMVYHIRSESSPNGLHCASAVALVAVLSLSSPGLGQPDNLFAIHARVLELRLAGNMADAIALAKRVVELSEKTLPPDDPFIKTSRDNLAALYEQARLALVEIDTLNRRVADLHRAGKPNEATPFAERSWTDRGVRARTRRTASRCGAAVLPRRG